MLRRTCSGLKPNGERCRANPLRENDYCLMHDPDHAEDVAEARKLGGASGSVGVVASVTCVSPVSKLIAKYRNETYHGLVIAGKCNASHGFPTGSWSIECSPLGRNALVGSPVQLTISQAARQWTHYTGKN